MAGYRINGYELYSGFGILPDQDRATADSFESPSDVYPVFSHDWGDGIIEYDLTSPTLFKARVLTIKGTLVATDMESYLFTRLAINAVLYENYVTLEQIETGEKYNAKIRPGGTSWHRLTNFTDTRILVAVQFQFDEVKQDVPYKDNGSDTIQFLVNNELKFYNTQDNKFIII